MGKQVAVAVEKPAGAVVKVPGWTKSQPMWLVPMTLELDDGTEHAWGQKFGKKRDAVAYLAKLPAAPRWTTFAEFDGGKLVATVTHIGIGRG